MGRGELVSGEVRRSLAVLGYVLGFGVSAGISCALTREAQGVAILWTANAFLAAALVSLPRRHGVMTIVGCVAANIGVYALLGDANGKTLVFAAVNVMESIAAAWAARKILGGGIRIDDLKRLARLAVLAVVPASALAATLSAGFLALFHGRSFPIVWRDWFTADALGLAMGLPAILILVHGRQLPTFRRPLWEQASLLAGVAAATALVYGQSILPMPFLVYALLTLLAFRLGPRGAVMGGVLSAVVAIGFNIAGQHGLMLSHMPPDMSLRYVELYSVFAFYAAMVTGTAVAGQARIQALFTERMRVAREARARAQQANAAKSEFLATMSHEIRTPMNSILGFTHVLQQTTDLPPAARRHLDLIDSAGESLLTVVNDILDFSKVEAGEVQLHLEPTGLIKLAEDAVAIAGEPARVKGLELKLSMAGPCDRTYLADEMRIRQVILNLLNNGVKFTEAGCVELVVEVTEADPIDIVRFTVTDTGVGIPLDRRDKLFERFSQVDSSVARTYGGTGLGLAISKGLVGLMDGAIGVRSAPGRGSSFWFEIPLARADAAAIVACHPEDEAALDGARVLLVDDHPMNRELGSTILGLLGCEVTLAENGALAVEAARHGDFDVILMDVHMPVMDGLAATRAIRALEGAAGRAPIIAMTADVLPENVERCRLAGMVDYVPKPVRPDALHGALSRVLSVSRDTSGLRRAVA